MQTAELEVFTPSEIDELASATIPNLQGIGLHQVPTRFSRKNHRRSQAAIDREIARVQERLNALRSSIDADHKDLLGLEQLSSRRFYSELERPIGRLEAALESLQKTEQNADNDGIFQRIDPSFLEATTWSKAHQCALPLFGTFSLNNPVCTLSVSGEFIFKNKFRGDGSPARFSSSVSPTTVQDFYLLDGIVDYARQKMTEQASKLQQPSADFLVFDNADWDTKDPRSLSTNVTATSTFAGAIPQEIRNIIRESQHRFEEILIVAEVKDWSLSDYTTVTQHPAPIPVGKDPLVLGRRGKLFWLLASFDTSPAEDYVSAEYVERKA